MSKYVLAAGALALLAGAAQAQIVPVFVNLSGANEVPANNSPATGSVTGNFDTATRVFDFSWSISGLVGTPASPGAHIHRGVIGTNGPVVFGFNQPGGSWPLNGSSSWTVPVADVTSFLNGGFYFNFHTTSFPSGEVRGQILPTPGVAGLALAGGVLAARRRRR